MLQLENRELRVDLLDPSAEAARLGPRFCGGGYVWQVHDARVGPLLSGPEFPRPDPAPFNGQGLPESFRHQTLEGRALTWRGVDGVALGAGRLRRNANGEAEIVQPARWEIRRTKHRATFETADEFAGIAYALTRDIELVGRELRSKTSLTNRSRREALRLQWFAHPFFALVGGMADVKLSPAAKLAENAGFQLDRGALTQKRRFLAQDDGHMERTLQLPTGEALHAIVRHPGIETVRFETSFAPDAFVLWGNDRTFSIEPYREIALAPGETQQWWLRYEFGSAP